MKKRNLIFAIISGFILAGSMLQANLWFLAWFAMIPLFAALKSADGRTAAFYGLFAGISYFGTILYWITLFGYLPWVVLTAVEALYFATFAYMSVRMLPCRWTGWGYIAVPSAWTFLQWLRSLGLFGFTWGSLAHTQAGNLVFAQLASVTGPWGLDFVVCLFNLAAASYIFSAKRSTMLKPTFAVFVVTACIWAFGYASFHYCYESGNIKKVAIIQGNLDQNVVPDANYISSACGTYTKMSLDTLKSKPDFIVWPETTLPVAVANTPIDKSLSSLAAFSDANMIVGAYDESQGKSMPLCYNGAYFYGKSGQKLGIYHKVHLVPYGEFVPLRDKMPFLKRYGIREQDVLAGKSHNLISTDSGKIGTNICFESLFPQISREETASGAELLFVLTNDAWFEKTQAARQHLMMSKLRAIENRRYVVRAAATGISAVIDPFGRTKCDIGIFKQGALCGSVFPLHNKTIYVRFGDYFAYICIIVTFLSFAITFRYGRSDFAGKRNQEN